MSGFRPLLVLPLLLAAFSGCFGEGNGVSAKEFDELPVPTWQSGYSWTYDVTSSYHTVYSDRGRPISDSETERARATFSVINDTSEIGGQGVYVLRADQHMDHPFLRGTIQAISKQTLDVLGYGYGGNMYGYEVAVPATRPMSSSYYPYPPQPSDPCDGVVTLTATPEGQSFPGLRFPIDDGMSWTGSWGAESDMPLFRYTSRAHGIVPVEVPGGVFPSVYVETLFEPDMPPHMRGGDLPFDFRIRSESWYSPDVRYLTKMVVTAKASGAGDRGGFGGSSFEFISTMQLRDFSLVPKPAEAIGFVVRDDTRGPDIAPVPHHQYRIVSDHAMPVEVGDGPVTLQLGLEKVTDGHGHDGRISSPSGEFPTVADIDHTTHEVVWQVGRQTAQPYHDMTWEEVVGDAINVTVQDGGRHIVQAHIRPIVCGDHYRNYASGDITTTFTKSFRVSLDPGLTRTVKAGAFQIFPEATLVKVEWKHVPTLGSRVDGGHPILVGPHGERRDLYGTPHVEPYMQPTGGWRIDWSTDGVTIGDDVQIDLRIVYDPWFVGK